MDGRSGGHDDILPLTTRAGEHPAVFASAFNSGDPDQVERVYEPDALLVLDPRAPVTGAIRRESNARPMALGLPITVRPRHVHEVGDIAFLVVDWEIRGTGPDGAEVDIRGTAADVARRGADGFWRYVVDSPFGTDEPPVPERNR